MDDEPPLNPTNSLGLRLVMGVVAPATNTTVQPEMEALRPPDVINAHARIPNPDRLVATDADSAAVRAAMVAGLDAALDTLVPARPDHVILGVMVENFVGDGAAGAALLADASARVGCPVTATTHAILAALAALDIRRVGLLSPFMPEGERAARRFLEEAGYAVVRSHAMAVPGPAAIARVPLMRLRAAVRALDCAEAEAIVQVGTNLPFAAVALEAEASLGKPVLASNPVTYWHALRRAGIDDRRSDAGVLFREA
jgi:maleate isomerase